MTKRWDETGKSLFFRKRSSLAGAPLQALGKLFFFKPRDGRATTSPPLNIFYTIHLTLLVCCVMPCITSNVMKSTPFTFFLPQLKEARNHFPAPGFLGLGTQKVTHNQLWKRVISVKFNKRIHPKPNSVKRASCSVMFNHFLKAAVRTSLS